MLLLVAVTYKYALSFKSMTPIWGLLACISALSCYFALIGVDLFTPQAEAVQYIEIFKKYFDVSNLFPALGTSLLSTLIFYNILRFFKKIHNSNNVMEINMRGAIGSILPLTITLLIFSIISLLVYSFFDMNVIDAVKALLALPFKNLAKTYVGGFFILLFQSIFWMFGIHGSNVFESLNTTIYAFNPGDVISKPLFDVFVLMGGCGATFGLLIAIFIFSKSRHKKKLGKNALIPMIFNINEIMVFGLPIVLNPLFVIPFIISPLVNFTTSYLALSSGLFSIVNVDFPWTTPIFFSGYISTGSVYGILLQLLNLVLNVLIYAPFVKLSDKFDKRSEGTVIDGMVDYLKKCDKENIPCHFMELDNNRTQMAILMIEQLRSDVLRKNITIKHQPHIKNKKIIGCETLLRWRYGTIDYVYPPLVVALATEAHLFDDLTKVIVEKALDDCKEFVTIIPDFKLSVNFTVKQLCNKDFLTDVVALFKKKELPEGCFAIEITEESDVNIEDNLNVALEYLHKQGILVMIDDFSMGHTSLTYFKNHNFDYIKIDGGLIKEIENERSNDIVSSIIALGKHLNYKIIAEMVENENQRKLLHQMGCEIYQGFLYYPAIAKSELLKEISKQQK